MSDRIFDALQYANEQLLTGLAYVGITTEKHGNLAVYSAAAAVLLALPATYAALKSRPVKRFSLENEVVIVTGGASGIGLELVSQLLARNSKVVVFDINKPATNGTARFYQTDVTDRKQVLQNAERVKKEIGEPSVLINNAGITTAKGAFLDADLDRQLKTIEVNLLSHFYTLRAFLPSMVKRNRGHVVTVASAASYVTPVGAIDYGIAKTGLLSLHEGLQVEAEVLMNAPDIQFTIVHPYFVTTPLIEGAFDKTAGFLDAPSVAASIIAQIERGQGAQLFLPGWVKWIPLIRCLPGRFAHSVRVQGARNMLSKRAQEEEQQQQQQQQQASS